MATVNPDPNQTGENREGQTMIGVDFNIGGDPDLDNINNPVGDTFMNADVKLGRQVEPENLHHAVNKRTVSVPSGLNIDGTLDFGDGPIPINTVWPDDNEETVEKGEFVYFHPQDIVKKDYKDLT